MTLARSSDFFVRLNEHLKFHWYTVFRNSTNEQEARDMTVSDSRALRTKISAKTLLYLSKCLNGDELNPKIDVFSRLKMESGFNAQMVGFAMDYLVAR